MSRRKRKTEPTEGSTKPADSPPSKAAVVYSAVFLVALIAAVYAPSLHNGFVYDDSKLIVNNPAVQNPGNIPSTFTRGYYPGLEYYRPLGLISHILDYSAWKLNPFGYHLTNLLAQIAASVLVYALFLRFIPAVQPFMAMLGTAAVACHPAITSAVMPIAARESIFCLAFTAASVLMFARGTRRGYAGALICLAGALLSKEIAVVVPGLWLAADVLETRRAGTSFNANRLRRYVPAVLVVGLYLVARTLALDTPGIFVPFGKRILYFAAAWLYLPQTLICPTTYLLYEPSPETWLSWPRGIVTGLVLAAILSRGLRSRAAQKPLLLFWLVWVVLTYLPTTNIASQETRWAERYLLLPAVGVAGLLLTLLSGKLKQRSPLRSPIGWTMIAVVTVIAVLGTRRSRYWADDLAFYSNWAHTEPSRAKAHLGLGIEFNNRHRTREAVDAINEALRLHPDFSAAHVRLGRIRLEQNRSDDALRHFEHAVRVSPNYVEAYQGLGDTLTRVGRSEAAADAYREAIRIDSSHAATHIALAAVLSSLDRLDEAAAAYRSGLAIGPDDAAARSNFGLLLIQRGQDRQARAELVAALELDPENRDIANNLAWLLATSKDRNVADAAEAIRLAEGICKADGSENPNYLDTLAAALASGGRFSEAVVAARKAATGARQAGLSVLADDLERRIGQYENEIIGSPGP